MGDLSTRNFGLLVAYVLPGFVVLWGLSVALDPVSAWLTGAGPHGPSVGGVLYVVLASVGLGMTVSLVRWLVVDTFHHCTGVPRPPWDDAKLVDRLPAYTLLIEIHYRYYQFYANTFIAAWFAYAVWSATDRPPFPGWAEVGMFHFSVVFLAGSRDALRKYYQRTAQLLGTVESEVSDDERRASRGDQDGGPEGGGPEQAGDGGPECGGYL